MPTIKRWWQNFILGLAFIEKAIEEAERQGGIKAFPLAQKDILETMRDDLDKQAEELAKKKLNDLLSNCDLKSIVSVDKQRGLVYVGGEKTDEARLLNLKSEAMGLESMEIWKLLYETPKKLAERALFNDDGKLENQLLKGRAILYTLDTQKTILDTFKSIKGEKKQPLTSQPPSVV